MTYFDFDRLLFYWKANIYITFQIAEEVINKYGNVKFIRSNSFIIPVLFPTNKISIYNDFFLFNFKKK